jgi:hypothetical protein
VGAPGHGGEVGAVGAVAAAGGVKAGDPAVVGFLVLLGSAGLFRFY